MSIFNIDWNSDGKIDFQDSVMDCIILDQLEKEDNDDADFDFGNDD